MFAVRGTMRKNRLIQLQMGRKPDRIEKDDRKNKEGGKDTTVQ
jgi:hypothetical protein